MARKVIWSIRAQQDRKDIFTYWTIRNKSNAYSLKLNRMFNEAKALIAKHPEIGRKTILENVRVKVVRDYLIIYETTDDTVVIHTIRDGRRDPSEVDYI
jgi:addiction module RelE/StbE family toxin